MPKKTGVRLVRLLLPAAALLVLAGSAAPAGGTRTPRFDAITWLGPKVHASPARPSVAWCGGNAESATDRTPEVELSAPEQFHVVYAIPSDGTDAFASYASPIASDAAAIDAWWRGQDPSRTWRFDRYAFPGCASGLGGLDISVVRLPQPGSYYGVDLQTRMQRLTADFRNRFNPRAKVLVYYDGPVQEPDVCGTAWIIPANGPNDQYGFGFIWLRSACPNDLGSGGLVALAAAHEMTHNLGAFTQAGAPHECPPPHQSHACDSPNDLMYWAEAGTLSTDALDVGRDDYYGHSNPNLADVQDSPWLSRLPQQTLSIALAGGGGGSVAMTQPATGLTCSTSCSAAVDNGLRVTLLAHPPNGARLVGWQGSCSGAGSCNLTMDGAKSVTAVFGPAVFALSVSVTGKGRVTSTPAGISCGPRCSHSYPSGTAVRLQAKPAKGFRFAGWSGGCRGKSACTLTVDRNRSASAAFKRKRR